MQEHSSRSVVLPEADPCVLDSSLLQPSSALPLSLPRRLPALRPARPFPQLVEAAEVAPTVVGAEAAADMVAVGAHMVAAAGISGLPAVLEAGVS